MAVKYFLLAIGLWLSTSSCSDTGKLTGTKTFSNPLLDVGPDPFSYFHNGYYYYTNTTQNNLTLWKTKNLANLREAEKKIVWTPPANTFYSKQIWAPEIHFIDNKWYMYFAADDGNNHNHRMYVVENTSTDPFTGDWVFKGKVSDATDKWAIDGNVFSHLGQMYMIWSGWEGNENGQQNIYIAKMSNPWTISSERVMISSPEYEWEKQGHLPGQNPDQVNVNEGPQFLKGKDRIFIIYSASGCWTDNYTLGMLTAANHSDLMNPGSWVKSPEPVFKPEPGSGIYGAGHNSFFKSPDGSEDWILYHANPGPGQGCGNKRAPRAQQFTWNKDGTPNFGKPTSTAVRLPVPAE